jgi:hypothetical protein
LCPQNYNGPYCNLENKYDSTSKTPLIQTNETTLSKISKTTTTTSKPITKTKITTTTLNNEEEEIEDEQFDEDEEEIESQPEILMSAVRTPCPSIIPNPCLNKGICMYLGYDITCKCPVTYSGTFCTERTDFCSKEPCQNNGTCRMIGKYEGKCICRPGYSGQFCEVNFFLSLILL